MQAEFAGRQEAACELFRQAWQAHRDDFEACLAAHYLARCQEDPAENLRWNQAALEHARLAGGQQAAEFYPSLYLNLGWSYESLERRTEALSYYRQAAASLDDLPAGSYRDTVAQGIENALARLQAEP